MTPVDYANVTRQDIAIAVGLQRAGNGSLDINEVEKGVFYTLSLTRNEPAYFIFVTLSLICLALRVGLHAFPHVARRSIQLSQGREKRRERERSEIQI